MGHWRPVVCEAGVPQVTASAESWLKETCRVRRLRRHIFHCQRRVCNGLDPGRDVCQSTSLINCRILMCPDRTLHTLRRNQCDSLHPSAVFMLRQMCFFPLPWRGSCAHGYMVVFFFMKRWRETEEVLPKQKKALTPYLQAVLHMKTNLLLLSSGCLHHLDDC